MKPPIPELILYLREERAHHVVAENRDEYRAKNVFWVPK